MTAPQQAVKTGRGGLCLRALLRGACSPGEPVHSLHLLIVSITLFSKHQRKSFFFNGGHLENIEEF